MAEGSAAQVLDYLAGQYGQSFELLLDGADTAMRALWLEAGGTDMAAWRRAAASLTQGVQTAAAEGAAAWMDVQVAAMGAQGLPPVAAVAVESAPAVLTSPPLRLQALLAQGVDYVDAMATTASYVGRLTSTMTRAAEHDGRAQRADAVRPHAGDRYVRGTSGKMRRATKGEQGLLLYVRVPDAQACAWCRMVADRLYTEEGVRGDWHAFCRCAWRLATPDDATGRLAGGAWEDLSAPRSRAKTAEQKAQDAEAKARQWREEARTTTDQRAETRYAKRADEWQAKADAYRAEATATATATATPALPVMDGASLGTTRTRVLGDHPDVQALPDGGVLLLRDLPADTSLAAMPRAVATKRNGRVVVTEVPVDEWDAMAAGGTVDAATATAERVHRLLDDLYVDVPAAQQHVRQVTISAQANPEDAYWAKKYNMPGFSSSATGGSTELASYSGRLPSLATIRHEYGHALDTRGGVSARRSESRGWADAMVADAEASERLRPPAGSELAPSLQGGHRLVFGNPLGVTTYPVQSASPVEDYAEAVRLYLADRRDGYIYKQGRKRVRFADLWPERAKVLANDLPAVPDA